MRLLHRTVRRGSAAKPAVSRRELDSAPQSARGRSPRAFTWRWRRFRSARSVVPSAGP